MTPKNYYFLSILALLFLAFFCGRLSETQKAQDDFNKNYKIYSLDLPSNLMFAGNKINITDFDVAERYDKELLVNVYWQSQTILLIKRANRYFPLFDSILKKNGIPSDFKYLALIESGLQNVVSPSGAAGYWQFLDQTGKKYGLEINGDEIDERYHVEKATQAACQYFREAYNEFNDWSLVAASFNMGIEGVKRQIKDQSVYNYNDLYLNTETARYLFRILALKEIYENPLKYGFNISYAHLYQAIPVVQVKVDTTITDLYTFCRDLKITYKDLKLQNPWLRKSYLKVKPGNSYYLAVPKSLLKKTEYWQFVKDDTLNLNYR